MKRIFSLLVILVLIGLGAGWGLTAPSAFDETEFAGLSPDLDEGEFLFYASGCASCHANPGAEDENKKVLSGGHRFVSPFGTFIAPNVSPHETAGIGGWSAVDLANAMIHGVSPRGQHYYPAFPYTSYAKLGVQDIVSLHAFLMTLPADATPSEQHEVGFPFNIRRSLGGWKLLFARSDWVVTGDLTEQQARGRWLVEGPGHCGECHSPRNLLGGIKRAAWLSGAPNPSGQGSIPNITPAALEWSEADIAEYLSSGFTPEFDTVGGSMTDVVANTSKLSAEDRAAIAAYLKIVPAVSKN